MSLTSELHVPGQDGQRELTLTVASRARRTVQRPDNPAAFLVTPIGDENSPWQAPATWTL